MKALTVGNLRSSRLADELEDLRSTEEPGS
jgi:hypothetical protein